MSSRMCNQCGCTDIDIDAARGDAVCTGCGSVLEDQIIVSEVQFQESSGGGSSLIGQFVSSDGPKSLSIGGSFPHGMQKESRTVTLQNGKKKIQQLASQMKLNQHCVDTAFNFFKMAIAKRMTRGRKTLHVVAACLYLVCRTERTPHMLLDFSDALQVNVYSLGKTYLHLSRELCISLPDIDPCLYIPRFAHALEFGDKTHEVSMTALRLVQRMKRDWMSTGRRPSGLCGAALLVAARIHDFSRTVKEVIRVVKVCQSTLRKRLTEFEETPSSQLTIEEFQTIDLEEEHDPPAFTEGKRKAKKNQEQSKLTEFAPEVQKLQDEIEETLLNQKPRGIWAKYAKMSDDCCSVDSDTSRLSDVLDCNSSADSSKTPSDSLYSSTVKPSSDLCVKSSSDLCVKPFQDISNCHSGPGTELLSNNEIVIGSEVNVLSSSDVTNSSDVNVLSSSDVISNSDVNVLSSSEVTSDAGITGLDMTKELVADCLKEGSEDSKEAEEEGGGELDLTGLDDAELDKFLLSEKEVMVKTRIWMAENAEYLHEQKLKEEKRAKEAEEEAKKPPEKRKKKIQRKKKLPAQEAATAQEAIQKIIQEKKISCKINYDVLNDLNVRSAAPRPSVQFNLDRMGAGSQLESKPSIARLRGASLGVDSEGPSVHKKMKMSDDILPILPGPSIKLEDTKPPDVVVESGPVQYVKDEGYGEEEVEEDYEEEEEDGHLSAAQLLGHTGVEEDYYDEMD